MLVNMTQHQATPDQLAAGVHDLTAEGRTILSKNMTFSSPPSRETLLSCAEYLIQIIEGEYPNATTVMIGGAPYLMAPLVERLTAHGIAAIYSFTKRESVDVHNADGSVTKNAIFKHVGWVHA